jgi:hypothetical protein
MNRERKRNTSLTAAVAAILVMLTALAVYAGHPRARDSVVIHARIFPSAAEAVPIKTAWNIQARLIQWTDNRNGRSGRTVGTQSAVANSRGEVTFVLPTHQNGANFTMEYSIVCLGGWAYHDGQSREIPASAPGEQTVSINMRRR